MAVKSIFAPRVIVASQQGSVIHIKSKQTGKVILKLKLLRGQYPGEQTLLLDECDSGPTTYNRTTAAKAKIDRFDGGDAA